MNAVNKMLDTVRESCSLNSDGALAEALGVSRQLVSQWRKGANPLSDERIAQIAKLGKLDAGAWTVLVNAEQARGEAKKSWASIIKRLGIASLLGLLVTFPSLAYTSSKGHETADHAVCIMRS
ncbi:helix-turn-helix domain-containing protein [Thermomonas fusca]|uniref:helix-turn-helix domain-containing protein n=1 Tax=Thermomonas fusca TaxID=215690 RepID=UPI00146A68F2|nr:helix-turn-helix domain-containing protein [Thermomonas fusca]